MSLINLFKNLAEIDSPSGEEKDVSDFVMKYLIDLGLNPIQDENKMIYCQVGDNPTKLFCAHLDTVEPGRGVEIIKKDKYLVSQGDTIMGGDNKVSLAAILDATKNVLESSSNESFELLFSVREETNSGIQDFDHEIIKSKVGFVFDYGGGDLYKVVKSAPFIVDFEVEIIGKNSHARNPEDGINTILILHKILSKISLGRPDKCSTLNIGILQTGDATNTVPGRMIFKGDLRSTKKENFERLKRNFENIIISESRQMSANAKINWYPYAFGYNLNLNSENFDKINSVYSNNLQPESTTSGSDAGFLNSIGIATYCLGDGVEKAHSTNERIKISRFEELRQKVSELMEIIF